jgi:hypothetical protein
MRIRRNVAIADVGVVAPVAQMNAEIRGEAKP